MLPFQELAAVAVALFALAATYTDLRWRIIPDWLNYGALLLAIALAHSMGLLRVEYLVLIGLAFLFSYALYRLGAWAGGDVKFYTALLAYYPLLAPLPSEPLGLLAPLAMVFLASAALLVPVLIALNLQKLWGERTHLAAALSASLGPAVRGAPLASGIAVLLAKAGSPPLALAAGAVLLFVAPPLWLALLLAAVALAIDTQLALASLAFALLAIAFLTFARSAFQVIAQRILRHPIPLRELQEGAIPARTLYLDQRGVVQAWEPPALREGLRSVLQTGNLGVVLPPKGRVLVDCLKARGVTNEEIQELQRLGVKELVVKESLAFAPVLALGLAVSVALARVLG